MKKRIGLIVTVAAFGLVALQAQAGVKPKAWLSWSDAGNFGTARWILQSIDPNVGPPNLDCFQQAASPACDTALPGQVFSQTGFAGSIFTGGAEGVNDMVTYLMFDAQELADELSLNGSKYVVRLNNVQNFSAVPAHIGVKIVDPGNDVDGDGVADRTSTGNRMFNGTNPEAFGPGFSGTFAALASARGDRGANHIGGALMPFGVGTLHAFGVPAATNSYVSFDSTVTIPLNTSVNDNALRTLKDWVKNALDNPEPANGHLYSCDADGDGLIETVAGEYDVAHPVYIAITALPFGETEAANRLQDGLGAAQDALMHVMGDCDFAGESSPGDSTFVEIARVN